MQVENVIVFIFISHSKHLLNEAKCCKALPTPGYNFPNMLFILRKSGSVLFSQVYHKLLAIVPVISLHIQVIRSREITV